MSSLQSHIVQIPRNSHFRPIPSLKTNEGDVQSSFLTFTATSGVAPRLTYNSATVGATGSFSVHPAVRDDGPAGALSSGTGILKDLGETIVSAGRTFRRVQLITPSALPPTSDDFNEMVGGTYTGVDSDALAGYIELGFRGVGVAGPFVRGY
jgi:hypothetical protein